MYAILNFMKNGKTSYVLFLLFAVLVIACFYVVFSQIGGLRADVKNVELQLSLNAQTASTTETATPVSTSIQPTPSSTPQGAPAITIPAAIIFSAQSSPALQPQTDLTVTVESVAKAADGTVTVTVKVFTSNASSYTALNPNDIFQMISLEGENQSALQVNGNFSSMPPKGSVEGSLTFKIDPTQPTFILQAGTSDNAKYYEFNFSSKTYKGTILG